MRGNDQPVEQRDRCMRLFRRANGPVVCEGGLDEVRAANGKLIGFRCTRCGRHFDEHRNPIREPAE